MTCEAMRKLRLEKSPFEVTSAERVAYMNHYASCESCREWAKSQDAGLPEPSSELRHAAIAAMALDFTDGENRATMLDTFDKLGKLP